MNTIVLSSFQSVNGPICPTITFKEDGSVYMEWYRDGARLSSEQLFRKGGEPLILGPSIEFVAVNDLRLSKNPDFQQPVTTTYKLKHK